MDAVDRFPDRQQIENHGKLLWKLSKVTQL